MKFIISTTGVERPNYLDMSNTPTIPVPQVEDIRYGRITGDPAVDRDYAHITLDGPQAVALVTELLMQLVDEDVLEGWNLSFPEAGEPVSARGEAADDADDEAALERVYGAERNEPCVHGHFDCATVEGGACANEEYAKLKK